jgi:dTMP kinase
MKTKTGLFITFEGIDGCGKSTHAKLAYEHLCQSGHDVIHTREPGGTYVAENIRKILLNPGNKIYPVTELMLYLACRVQHTEEIVRPAVAGGKIVICERYTDSTVAYQGYGRKINLGLIKKLNTLATSGLRPDLTIFIDIPVTNALAKISSRKKTSDRLDNETKVFHTNVRKGFLMLAAKEPGRIKKILFSENLNITYSRVERAIDEFISRDRPR